MELTEEQRQAKAIKRREDAHRRFLTNHLPGTTLMFAAKRTRDRSGRRLEWHQQKYLMWSQDYEVTKKFVDDEIHILGLDGKNPNYQPIEIERIFLMRIGGQWHRVYSNRFVLGDLKLSELCDGVDSER